jgi:hypothetical protein
MYHQHTNQMPNLKKYKEFSRNCESRATTGRSGFQPRSRKPITFDAEGPALPATQCEEVA